MDPNCWHQQNTQRYTTSMNAQLQLEGEKTEIRYFVVLSKSKLPVVKISTFKLYIEIKMYVEITFTDRQNVEIEIVGIKM